MALLIKEILSKSGLINGIHEDLNANIILNGEIVELSSLKIRKKEKMLSHNTSINYCTRDSNQCNKAIKRNMGIRKEVQWYIFADNIVV